MRTILIAKADLTATSQRVNLLAGAGYNVITCPGPWPPDRCSRHTVGYCPLTESADLMLYDPTLEGHDTNGQACTLAIDSGLAHPDVPLVLDADDASYPQAMLDAICAAVPSAEVAERETPALLAQIQRLLDPGTPAPGSPGSYPPAAREKDRI
jgi:hypothetical protein